jgi:type IV pilus biogenesis protein CpaD/CtpE
MSDDRNFKDEDTSLDPEDVNSGPSDAAHAAAKARLPDPNDVIPVPGAMSPAEVDERAQVVEKLREETGVRRDDDDTGMR